MRYAKIPVYPWLTSPDTVQPSDIPGYFQLGSAADVLFARYTTIKLPEPGDMIRIRDIGSSFRNYGPSYPKLRGISEGFKGESFTPPKDHTYRVRHVGPHVYHPWIIVYILDDLTDPGIRYAVSGILVEESYE